MQLASKKTLEELVLDFTLIYEAYSNEKNVDKPSKKALDAAFLKLKLATKDHASV